MTFTAFLEHFRGVRRAGQHTRWTAECPAHDDRSRNTLQITLGAGGRRLIKCWAGCRLEEILAGAQLGKRDLFDDDDPPPPKASNGRRRSAEPGVPSLTTVLLGGLARVRAQMAAYGPLYRLSDEIRGVGGMVAPARRLVTLLGPDDDLAWEIAALAAELERDAAALEAEQDALLEARRRA